MISKMGYQDSNVLIFCVWKRRNRKPGIVRVQSWGDVRSGTPRIEPQTGQASSRKIWDIITVSGNKAAPNRPLFFLLGARQLT